jgi:polyene macrolide polyketide synthase
MVEAMRHGLLPPTLHVDDPSPHVDWSAGEVELLTEPVEWPAGERPRRAAVSSFGVSGTNAHLILEEAPSTEAPEERSELPALPFPISAHSEHALRAQADRLHGWVAERHELEPVDVAFTLATTRARLERRAAIVGSDREELLEELAKLARGEAGAVEGAKSSGKTAVMFTGQGAQWAGMGAELYERYPRFAEALDAVCAEIDPKLERPLKELMFAEKGSGEAELLDRTEYTQAALFAIEVALYRLFEAWGLRPDYLIGHSIGELVAAHVVGMLSLADACALVAARGCLMGTLPEGGGMLAISATEDEVAESLKDYEGRLSLAAVNAPRAVVVSGELEALDQLEPVWKERGANTKRLRVSHAFHSLLMEPMLEDFRQVAEGLDFAEPRIEVVSNLTGGLAPAEMRDPGYWVRHVREPVRFADGVAELERLGVTRFVELGPDGVLAAMARLSVGEELGDHATFATAMSRKHAQVPTLVGCLAALHGAGAEFDWDAFFEGSGARVVDLPPYAFQRERYWLDRADGAGDLAAAGQLAAEHPLLGATVELAGGEGWVFTGRLSLKTHPWLADHAVMDTVLLPGTAFVELALAAAGRTGAGGVEELTLMAPLVLDGERAVQVAVAAPDEDGRRTIEIYSRPEAGADDADVEWTLHASGALAADGAAVPGLDDFAAASWPPEGTEEVDVGGLYDDAAAAGYDYGPAFQGLRRAYRNGDAWFAEVALDGDADGFRLHPGLFDAALHTMLLERGADDGAPPAVPFSFSGVTLARDGAASLRVRIESAGEADDDGATTIRLLALDDSGAPAFAVEALEARPVDRTALRTQASSLRDALFAVEWTEVESADAAGASAASNGSGASANGSAARVALLGDGGDGAGLEGEGIELVRHPDLEALEKAIGEGAAAPEVVLVRAPSAAAGAGVHGAAERTLELLQAWLASEALTEARLVLMTDGAVAVAADEAPNLDQAALVGLVRSAHTENPGRFGIVDLDGSEASASRLGETLASEEPELALRRGTLYAPRLARAGAATPPTGASAWRLGIEQKGSLENLALMPSEAAGAALEEGQVRVAMRAAGLNFRDVLIALGIYPGEAPLGSEGAGVVVEVGPGVERLAPGDRVMGFFGEAFGSHAIGEHQMLVPIPAGWSYAQAAAVPTVFLTAYYALFDLAEIERGERLLVHGAAGGVGMAALQLAEHAGAEVYATAHPGKWDTLRELGVDDDHIASSRDLDFRERFLSATGGEGMNVVLDSLANEFVDASLELLPRGGRFVEIGKADVREADEVAREHEGVRYRAFDLIEAGPERIQEMLVEVVELFERGVLRHPPISAWDVRRGAEAFRHMREARHVGKIVLSIPGALEPEGTVLVTGGTGGLGALLARHLAEEHGVRRLVLTSRRGAEAEGAKEVAAALEELGCAAELAACDVADRDQLEALLARIPDEHPLTAVVHAAGVLDDGLIGSLDAESVRRVMAPKVDGALNLHRLTRDLDLAQFVLFSSIAATVGSPGQANYSAANAFLDALAHHRVTRGLAATAMAWGPWERGMAAGQDEADRARAQRMGMTPLADEEGLALFDASLTAGEAVLVPVRLDTAALRAAGEGLLPPILSGLIRVRSEGGGDATGSLQRRLSGVPESKWSAIVLDMVRDQVASVRGLESGDAVKPDLAFKEMGFDSLAAVELRNGLTRSTGIRLPATLVFDHPTPSAVAEHVLGRLPRPDAGPSIEDEFDRIERLLHDASMDERTRSRMEARVRTFNSRVQSLLMGSSDGDDGDRDEDLGSVSNEEVFALIDKEIGAS